MATPLRDILAGAIRDADNRLFNENYTRQAEAALTALRKAGFEVVPAKPPPDLVQEVLDAMPYGRQRPADYVARLYLLFVEAVRKRGL